MIVSNRFLKQISSVSELKTYQVGVLEAAAHRALRQHKDELLKGYGLTGSDWYLIGTVADAGKQGIRSTDLAQLLGVTMGFLTKTTALLEAKGILIKKANAKDARSNYIALNSRYRRTLDEIEQALRHKLKDSIYSLVTPEELTTYIKVLEKFGQL